MTTLDAAQVTRELSSLADWTREGDTIVRRIKLPTFPDAIAFTVKLAFEAEAADHHPDLTISYRSVTISYSTHSEGGLTEKDFEGARTVERLLSSF